MKKLLPALMLFLLLCALCHATVAVEVDYIYYTWDEDTRVLTRHDGTCANATPVISTSTSKLRETAENGGWYVVDNTLTFVDYLTVSGNVHLILEDGLSLKVNGGIEVNEGSSLSIYAQSEDAKMGALTVSNDSSDAAIGGGTDRNSGLITIHGGNIEAKTLHLGAAIGGGGGVHGGDGTVTIYGGSVLAITNNFCAAIGGGGGNGNGGDGTVTIRGGTVEAVALSGNSFGAAIGGGRYGGSGTVKISGGTVTATASGRGAAIGNGEGGFGGCVTITGGRVSAKNTDNAALSIGGDGCEVSLGWRDAGDSVDAKGYTGSVALAKAFRNADTGEKLPAGAVADVSEITGQLLPDIVRDVEYIEYSWDDDTKVLSSDTKTCAASELTGGEKALGAGWYVAEDTLTYDESRLTVSGDVHLILADKCSLTAEKGITVEGDNTLSIYAQSEDAKMGALTVPEQGSKAGIGSTQGNNSGLITIHGGKIEAAANYRGAGIGGSENGSGTVTIYGGAVTATTMGISAGAGIGGGFNGAGTVEIHGGTVTATAVYQGAGIGGGYGGAGTVTIHGGTVTATAMSDSTGAGIGGGENGDGTIEIHGGTVTATTNDQGAGIGGGVDGTGTVKISGGMVTATAMKDSSGAGIGGGNRDNGTVEISGGTVTATANDNGAGIGGGNQGNGKVKISGGTVTATAMENSNGAGIGGGYSYYGRGGSGEVTISGGTVTATASGSGAAIGNCYDGHDGSVTVTGSSVIITGGSVSAVHTVEPELSIGGPGECTVSLGLTQKNDSVYAAGYTTKDTKVTLTAALQDAGTGEKFPEEGDASPEEPAGIDADKLGRKLLIPDTEEAARQQAWNDKAVTFRLPGSLGGIGSGAFQNIRAATVLVPRGVKSVGADAFRGSGVKRIRFENGNPETFDASAFEDCPFVIVYTPAQGKVYEALKDLPNIYIISK